MSYTAELLRDENIIRLQTTTWASLRCAVLCWPRQNSALSMKGKKNATNRRGYTLFLVLCYGST